MCIATTSRRKCLAYLRGKAAQKAGNPKSNTLRSSFALNFSYFVIRRGIRVVVDGYFTSER